MRIRKSILAAITLLLAPVCLQAAPRARDFQAVCDSLRVRLRERTGVDTELRMTRVSVRGQSLDLYFSSDLSYYPWREDDVKWLRRWISAESKPVTGEYGIGRIFTNRYEIAELILPNIGSDGKPSGYERAIPDPRTEAEPFVERVGAMEYAQGLSGRHIALWQSHGRYYDENRDCWLWQRACLHRTVEDMLTPGFVLPFLIPMLENAGAYVMTPRERDIQWREIICDNDPSFSGPRQERTRKAGRYSEKGRWDDAGEGFADLKPEYSFSDRPFVSGTARMAACSGTGATATARWTPDIEERGEYAVYVSYKTLGNSSTAARYTVSHLGGKTEFKVNQRRGGGTWIYLGTFEFGEGDQGYVSLDNRGEDGCAVTADAVKIGGGMGKMERGGRTSGMPSWMEGAHYWMHWAGADSTITRGWDTDYTNDFASRGIWTAMMKEQKDIPFDLSLAFHTDAGVTPNDSTIGTLAIYTLRCDGEREFSDGRDRIISRLLADYVQTQIVSDLREDFDPQWSRRGLWDKSYSECRTSGVPAMILELLSHQNFADMKYGLDPAFRFSVCRAVYKGVLKTLSEYYGCDYAVQPLPVEAFALRIVGDGKVRLEWKPRKDPKEPTAASRGYMVYTRVDDGAFDGGVRTESPFLEVSLDKGHIYSFKVEAYNEGGRSFPSETLSAGFPQEACSGEPVLIVNNFDRVCAPDWVDTPGYAGFDGRKNAGIPYVRDISYIGDNYEFDRSSEFVDNDYPGFGASHDERAGEVVAGNSFDYPYMHGRALFELGYPFYSMSRDAFCDSPEKAAVLDLICGKQGGSGHGIFPEKLRGALAEFTACGGCLFVSGSNLASDGNGDNALFLSSVLGIRLATPFGTSRGIVGDMEFANTPNPEVYCVESPDGINPSSDRSAIWLRYPGTSFGAAVYHDAGTYRSVNSAVPPETLKDEDARRAMLGAVLDYFNGASEPVLRIQDTDSHRQTRQ